MARRASPSRARALALSPGTAEAMRAELPAVAEQTVAAIIVEVPSYADAFSGPMGRDHRQRRAAGAGRLPRPGQPGATASRRRSSRRSRAPTQLGRGEARSGRSMDALLAAYRVGARVVWRHMSRTAVDQPA